jgi:hypothetical protein
VLTNPELDTNTPPGILSGSPCLGAATSGHAPATDFWGNARSTTSEDIGAVAGPPQGTRPVPPPVTLYSQAFTQGATPTTQCSAWTAFTSSLTNTTYGTLIVGGSASTVQATCTGSEAATICEALHAGTTTSASCGGHTWYVGTCGSGTELSADNAVCSCGTTGFTVRPCIGNDNWGGIEGVTCDAASQTLTVTCE